MYNYYSLCLGVKNTILLKILGKESTAISGKMSKHISIYLNFTSILYTTLITNLHGTEIIPNYFRIT